MNDVTLTCEVVLLGIANLMISSSINNLITKGLGRKEDEQSYLTNVVLPMITSRTAVSCTEDMV